MLAFEATRIFVAYGMLERGKDKLSDSRIPAEAQSVGIMNNQEAFGSAGIAGVPHSRVERYAASQQ